MERPDIGERGVVPGTRMRLVATTQSAEEAERVAEQYGLQGFETRVVKRKRGALAVYEVWAGKDEAPSI